MCKCAQRNPTVEFILNDWCWFYDPTNKSHSTYKSAIRKAQTLTRTPWATTGASVCRKTSSSWQESVPEVLCCSLPCATNDFTNAAHSLQRLEVTDDADGLLQATLPGHILTSSLLTFFLTSPSGLKIKVGITRCTTPCVSRQICMVVTVWIQGTMKWANLVSGNSFPIPDNCGQVSESPSSSPWEWLFSSPSAASACSRERQVGKSRTHELNMDNLPPLKEVPQNLRTKVLIRVTK